MIFGQSNFLQALGWAVLNSLWQMAFLWVIYQVITGIFRNAKSAQKSSLASGLLIAGFAWFAYTFLSILAASTPGNGAITSVMISTGNNEQLNEWLQTMLPVASLIYLVLLALPVFNFIRNYRYVQVIRQYKLSKTDVEWRIFVKNVAARMGIKKPVHIWLSGIVTSPVTIGYLKPVILLPLAAVNHLNTQQIEAILLHELAHIRRHDYLLNLVIRFIQVILYFNPFVKAFIKIIERERELSCDEMVLQFQYDPYGYASALLTLEKNNHHPKPLAVAAAGKKADLLHRIECMLGVQKKQVLSFNKLAGLFAGLLCFIVLNALLIISKPAKDTDTVDSLTSLSSPFYLFSDGEEKGNLASEEQAEIPAPSIVNIIKPTAADNKTTTKPESQIPETPTPAYSYAYTSPVSNLFMNVALTELNQPPVPQLKGYQEEQVKEVVEASRKVLEEKQWKAVENKIADVMTTYEKSIVKSEYDKEMSKVDWKKMEDKLRLAYDNIEWNKVNEELNKAVAEIKIDSLHQAYTQAMVELTTIQQQLCENNLKGIPDSDISLKAVEQGKKDVQKAINNLIKVKTRKIVHL
ncbi:MAG TPA: M56 family metallopeptidase [Chitinophagaceae bacterium]